MALYFQLDRSALTIGTLINVPPKNRILIFLCRGYGLVGGVRDCVLVLLMQGVRLLWTGYDFFGTNCIFFEFFFLTLNLLI